MKRYDTYTKDTLKIFNNVTHISYLLRSQNILNK